LKERRANAPGFMSEGVTRFGALVLLLRSLSQGKEISCGSPMGTKPLTLAASIAKNEFFGLSMKLSESSVGR